MGLNRLVLPLLSKVSCQEDWKDVCAVAESCIFKLSCYKNNSYCGGFFINSRGYGITAYDFYDQVNGRTDDCVLNYKGSEYKFEIINKSKENHVIVIKVKNLSTKYLKFANKPFKLGENVIAFSVNLGNTTIFEPGYILDLYYQPVSDLSFGCIRSSCRTGPGYSGGPILNRQGEVIGVQKSNSNLYTIYDSVAVPGTRVTSYLNTISKETAEGWDFNIR